jgi:hypothetical protein
MKLGRCDGDTSGMPAASSSRALGRGAGLLLAHCAAGGDLEERAPVAERLQGLLGPDLTRLLLVALVGDHRMGLRDLAA